MLFELWHAQCHYQRGRLFHSIRWWGLFHLLVKKLFLLFNLNLPCCSFITLGPIADHQRGDKFLPFHSFSWGSCRNATKKERDGISTVMWVRSDLKRSYSLTPLWWTGHQQLDQVGLVQSDLQFLQAGETVWLLSLQKTQGSGTHHSWRHWRLHVCLEILCSWFVQTPWLAVGYIPWLGSLLSEGDNPILRE